MHEISTVPQYEGHAQPVRRMSPSVSESCSRGSGRNKYGTTRLVSRLNRRDLPYGLRESTRRAARSATTQLAFYGQAD